MSTQRHVDKAINIRAYEGNCNRPGVIELRSAYPADYINIRHKHDGCTVHADDAKALRDALLEIYPITDQTGVQSKPRTWKGKQAYKGNGKHTWERVTKTEDGEGCDTMRLRVPGGWLYSTPIYADGEFVTANTVFVPMPNIPGAYPI